SSNASCLDNPAVHGPMLHSNRPIPEPGPNEVLIQMHSVGICGSDVHLWQDGRAGCSVGKKPMVLGHEGSGRVLRVGSGVTHLQPGDREAIEPAVPSEMDECVKSGRYHLSPNIFFYFCYRSGMLCKTRKKNGSLILILPDNVSYEEGALIELLSVGIHACRRAGVTLGSSVLVCKAGQEVLKPFVQHIFGALLAFILCVVGYILFSRVQKSIFGGITLVFNHSFHASWQVFLHQSYTLLLDNFMLLYSWCNNSSTSVQLGLMACFQLGKIKELIIFKWPLAIDMVASNKVNVKPLVTHRFPLEEALQAFETMPQRLGIKVMLKCDKNDQNP
uniref:Sorbitol dehydrogenase n=1 Tax=Astyanax mexicanus TaxID=7994 RepID=A0A8B9GQ85_ASTMX